MEEIVIYYLKLYFPEILNDELSNLFPAGFYLLQMTKQ